MRRLVLILFLLKSFSAAAQQPDIVFHHLTEKDGLSYNIVNCFLKDSRGVLWIGTYNGLNKYDGAHFFAYHTGPNNNTLPSNTVHKLAEDKNGNIWGATDNGVFCLNWLSGYFKRYWLPSKNKWPSVFNICYGGDGKIWASSNAGLAVFNAAADSFQLAPSKEDQEEWMIRKNGLAESPDARGFWLTTNKGLKYYDKKAAMYVAANNNIDSTLFNTHGTSAICKTSFGHYWHVDNRTKTIIGFDPFIKKVKYSIKANELEKMGAAATLFEDASHVLWLCTWNYELFMIDYLHGNKVTRIRHNKNDPSSIAGDFFWDAMQETDGNLWLGTVGGISKCNPSRTFYKVHHLPKAAHNGENPAIVFLTDNPMDKSWWFVTTKNILVRYDPLTAGSELFAVEKFETNHSKKTPEYINRMIFLKDSIFLFAYNGAWLKKGNGSFKPLQLKAPYNNWVLRDADLWKGHILYTASPDKVLRWDLTTGQQDSLVITDPVQINNNPPAVVRPVLSNNGRLWMMSGKDWLSYSDKNELKMVKMNYQPETEEDDGYFTDMMVDSRGVVWMTKKGDGLVYYDPAAKKSKQLKQHDGLVMDHVMAVAEDSSGKIWSGAYNQFAVYNPLLNSFYNFTLPISTNNYAYVNNMKTLGNGNIIANVAGDAVEFFTNRLKAPQVKDKPLISMFSINGADTNLYYFNNLRLASFENSLRIKFGMLTDNVVTPYDMLYIMEGAENNWTTASTNFEATYNSLPPGSYTFKVKALAKDKSWQTAETVLQLHIATPFYRAWWFYVLLSAILLATVVGTYRYRMSQKERLLSLENKAQLLEKEKTQVMYENLKQHLNPHFLFNSLTSLSSLIRIDQKMAGNFLDKMSRVYRYILKNRDNETVPLSDEIKFVQLYIDLQKTRFEKGLSINMDIAEEYHHRKIAPVTLQNLVENAIKHNTADAEAPLSIDLFIKDDYLVVMNTLQKKNFVETSNKQGLGNMQSLYRFLSDRPMTVEETDTHFIVKVPLI
jgi:ligand-binding sensor domain-containing protein